MTELEIIKLENEQLKEKNAILEEDYGKAWRSLELQVIENNNFREELADLLGINHKLRLRVLEAESDYKYIKMKHRLGIK